METFVAAFSSIALAGTIHFLMAFLPPLRALYDGSSGSVTGRVRAF